jgi:elongation factor P
VGVRCEDIGKRINNMIPATQLKVGNVILYDNELYRVSDLTHVTPGKGRGMMQVKLYSYRTENYYEKRFRSDESIDVVHMDRKEMEFLYQSDTSYVFMDTKTYDQVDIPAAVLEDAIKYLLPNTRLIVDFYEGSPVGIELPITVDLEISETDPPLKGATASASPKNATLETGIVVKVPQFLQTGDIIRIDTRDDSFVERVKK